ncbi:hypothetical protein CR513_30139, partial [Mucuna pruriens]
MQHMEGGLKRSPKQSILHYRRLASNNNYFPKRKSNALTKQIESLIQHLPSPSPTDEQCETTGHAEKDCRMDNFFTKVGGGTQTSLGEDNTKVKFGISIDLHPCNIKTKGQKQEERKRSLQDTMTSFMTKTDERLKVMEAHISTLATLMTQRVYGPPPPLQIEPTPKEEIKVITLRSGKVKRVSTNREEGGPTKEAIANVVNKGKKVATLDQVNVSFPQRLKDEKKDKKFTRFLEIFRKLHINIPFIELAHRTITHPHDIEKDIPVKMGKAIIDVEKGELILRLGNEEVKFTVFSSDKIFSPLVSCNCVQAFDNSKGTISSNYKRKSYFETQIP